jgi:Fe-S-cluster containining protein
MAWPNKSRDTDIKLSYLCTMEHLLPHLVALAKDKHAENKKYFDKLKRKPPKQLDYLMTDIHEEVFDKTDCLACANCCKTTGPLFTAADIERIAAHLKMKPQQFVQKYLHVDEDGDHVLQHVPCTFLDSENYCLIYEVRPKACREYPHTNRRKFNQITDLTLKNTAICPAAFAVVEEMKRRLPL